MLEMNNSHNQKPITKILRPFQEFVNAEVSSGIVLIIVVILAMIIANSPLSEYYFSFWLMPL
jgi:NhaA family Na+:H+ antiporter